MTFTVSDFRLLVEMAYKHPEWRAELRQLVLTDDILSLPQAMRELAEAQKRTEAAVEELTTAQKRTETELRNLSNRVGSTVEEEAESVLWAVLGQQGYQVGEAYYLRMNGEVDVVLPLLSDQGQQVWAVVEAKTRPGRKAVEAWAQRMNSAGFQARLKDHDVSGPYLVYAYGMRVDSGARQAAEQYGIGVASSQGEIISPAGLIDA